METKVLRSRWMADWDGTWLMLLVEDSRRAREFAEENAKNPLRLKLTRWKEKRSLSANAYAWLLLNKLSEALSIPAEEIYKRLIPDVGGNCTAVCAPLQSLDGLRRGWQNNGAGWVVEVIGVSDAPGMVDVMLYYGSSVYDTAQMSRLLELIIQECRQNDIEYLPPEKLEAMMEVWDAKQTN